MSGRDLSPKGLLQSGVRACIRLWPGMVAQVYAEEATGDICLFVITGGAVCDGVVLPAGARAAPGKPLLEQAWPRMLRLCRVAHDAGARALREGRSSLVCRSVTDRWHKLAAAPCGCGKPVAEPAAGA